MSYTYKDYIRPNCLPTAWCAGCGDGQILKAMLMAFADLDLQPDNTVICSGIGCWGKCDTYTIFNGLHGTHGRMPAYATGLKVANPELNVICAVGDGDGVTIGGNHFIHAARRNLDITVIMSNNYNYGMTGGQYSGTTPEHSITSTSRYGHVENGFDVCKLAEAAGATFVARSTSDNVLRTKKLIEEGIRHKGFSLIEVVSQCTTHYARNNSIGSPADHIKWIRDREVPVEKAKTMSEEELKDKIVVGKIYEREDRDFLTRYREIFPLAEERMKNTPHPEQYEATPLARAWKLIFAGVGGQGAILCGNLMGTTASREAKTATMLSAYGGEARGTYSKSDLQISTEELNDFVEVHDPDLVTILHQKAYERHWNNMRDDAVIIYNSDEVEVQDTNVEQIPVPMSTLAKEAGNYQAMNMVALGATTAYTRAVSIESVEKVVREFFASKPKFVESNVAALLAGYRYIMDYNA